jgi:hypothetical protein
MILVVERTSEDWYAYNVWVILMFITFSGGRARWMVEGGCSLHPTSSYNKIPGWFDFLISSLTKNP